MRTSRTLKTRQPSSSADSLRLTAPKAWRELTQDQLRYVLTLMTSGLPNAWTKTCMLVRFTGMEVMARGKEGWAIAVKDGEGKRRLALMSPHQIAAMTEQMDYIDRYEDMGIRLDTAAGLTAIDIHLHGLPFIDYLNAEKSYQGYIMSRDDRPLMSLFRILYRDKDGKAGAKANPTPAELFGAFLWYAYVKTVLSKAFPHFLRPAGEGEHIDVVKSMNAQIRALTDGDVTKEEHIYNIDCWRALTELDAKALEGERLRKATQKTR